MGAKAGHTRQNRAMRREDDSYPLVILRECPCLVLCSVVLLIRQPSNASTAERNAAEI